MSVRVSKFPAAGLLAGALLWAGVAGADPGADPAAAVGSGAPAGDVSAGGVSAGDVSAGGGTEGPAAGDAAPSGEVGPDGSDAAALPEAKPHGFSSRVEPDKVELGRPFRLVLEVRHDPAETYALAGEPDLGGLVVRGAPHVERTEADGTATTRIVFDLVAFDALGERKLPDPVLVAEGPAGRARLVLPGPPLTVVAVSEGEELVNPPPQALFVIAWDRIAWGAGGVLALLLLVWAIWRWRHRRKAAPEAAAEVDRRTPEERALEALAAVEGDAGLSWRERYFRLSALVRGFLAGVSDLPAVDRTTEELCEELTRRQVPGLSPEAFRAWMARGDLVRFAKEEPSPEAAAADFAEARATVRGVAAAIREEARRREEALAAAAGAQASASGAPDAARAPIPAPRDDDASRFAPPAAAPRDGDASRFAPPAAVPRDDDASRFAPPPAKAVPPTADTPPDSTSTKAGEGTR
jgi:hypothetical protein